MIHEDHEEWGKSLKILLVEDTEADIKIAQRAFAKAKYQNQFTFVKDGQAALDFIYHRPPYTDPAAYPRPDLILLDINMPKMDGIQVLKTLKSDPKVSMIPVIMFTTSKDANDINNSYNYGAAGYIPKPVSYEAFVRFVDGFNYYWNVMNQLPDRENSL
ncbi:response regulator [PVC group bacterium]|nr:response regulator [PVC group bacterium]